MVTVSTTRSMTWRNDCSRPGAPSGPRKYFWATMLVAFCDQLTGNSTSRCSKATDPSRKLVMRASRRCHRTSSYGWVSGVVKWRRMPMPVCSGAMAMGEISLLVLRWVSTHDHNMLWLPLVTDPRCGIHTTP